MSRLLRAELTRALWRRATAGALLVLVVLGGLMLWGTHHDGRNYGDPAQARQAYEQSLQDWRSTHVEQEQACRSSVPPEEMAQCAPPEPRPADFLPYGGDYKQMIDSGLLVSLKALLLFAGFLLGATLVCTEFASGSISTWLTFVPRRTPVYLSKLGATAVVGLLLTTVTAGLVLAGSALVARSLHIEVPGPHGGEVLSTMGRAALLGLAGGLAGAAVGFVTRRAAAALGVAIGYLIGVEMILAGAVEGAHRWLLSTNVSAFVDHGTHYQTVECAGGDGACRSVSHHVGFLAGTGYLAGVLVLLGLLGWLAFTRRDIG